MRRLAVSLVSPRGLSRSIALALGLSLALGGAVASAQPAGAMAPAAAAPAGAAAAPAGAAAAPAGAATELPPAPMTTREIDVSVQRRSGFWTSPHPAKGGAYRWRLLAIGGGLAAVMGLLVLWVVRRAARQRAGAARGA